jgi:hypothetical protein
VVWKKFRDPTVEPRTLFFRDDEGAFVNRHMTRMNRPDTEENRRRYRDLYLRVLRPILATFGTEENKAVDNAWSIATANGGFDLSALRGFSSPHPPLCLGCTKNPQAPPIEDTEVYRGLCMECQEKTQAVLAEFY